MLFRSPGRPCSGRSTRWPTPSPSSRCSTKARSGKCSTSDLQNRLSGGGGCFPVAPRVPPGVTDTVVAQTSKFTVSRVSKPAGAPDLRASCQLGNWRNCRFENLWYVARTYADFVIGRPGPKIGRGHRLLSSFISFCCRETPNATLWKAARAGAGCSNAATSAVCAPWTERMTSSF